MEKGASEINCFPFCNLEGNLQIYTQRAEVASGLSFPPVSRQDRPHLCGANGISKQHRHMIHMLCGLPLLKGPLSCNSGFLRNSYLGVSKHFIYLSTRHWSYFLLGDTENIPACPYLEHTDHNSQICMCLHQGFSAVFTTASSHIGFLFFSKTFFPKRLGAAAS